MKNLFIPVCCLILFSQSLAAQYNFYNWTLYGNISPKQTPVINDLFVNRMTPEDEFRFNLNTVKSSLSLGIRRNFKFSSPFFGTLGAEYSQKEETYSLLFTYPSDNRTKLNYELQTTRRTITIPAGVGVRMGRLDVTSGLLARYTMSSTMKEEIDMGMEMTKSRTDVGWYTGVGINFNRLRVGVSYQSMLCRDGHQVIYKGAPLELLSVPHNVSFNVGISF